MLKQKRKHIFFLLICVFVFGFYFNFKICVQAKDFSLTVIHTNDSHGTVSHEPYIKTLAEQKKNNGENVLILSAGDLFHGQLIASLSRGDSIVNIFNTVGYNYITAGNHDFNYGLDRLKEIESQGKFKILVSNVVDKATGANIFLPYDIKEIDGFKVGIFGLSTPETIAKTAGRKSLEGTEFLSPIETAKKIVNELKSQGCKIIIAITHLGLDNATLYENRSNSLAENVPEIDLIIDGHSHTELKNGLKVNNTLIAQTGAHGNNIGVVELKFSDSEKNNSVLEKKAYLIKMDDNKDILPDKNVLNVIEEENKKIEGFASQKVGKIEFELDGKREHVRTVETNFFDLLTDAILEKTKSDLVILNGGIIRDSIQAGEITVGDIYKSLPFENTMITQNMSGKEILKALEHGVSQYPNVFGGNLQVGGIKFKFDPNKKAGEKIYDIYFLNSGKKFDLDKKYNLATIKFLFEHGDGYDMFTKNESYKEYTLPQEMLVEYIKNHDLEKYREVQNRIVAQEQKQNKTIEKIGAIEFELDGKMEHVYTVETNFFDLLTDVILKETRSDIVILNGGIIQNSVKSGEITVGDIYKSLPFKDIVVTQNMNGKEILKALEHGVSQYPNVFGGNLQVGGIKFKFDPNKKAGERIYDIYFLDSGKKFDLDKQYNLATTNFTFEGGDGYDMFTKNESYKEYTLPQEMLIEYIKNHDLGKYREVQNRIVTQKQNQEQKNDLAKPVEYKIKKGDTLWKISLRFKVSLDKLIKLNKIKNPDLIYPNHILKIS